MTGAPGRVIRYPDGCRYAECCLDCPLPDCSERRGRPGGAANRTAEWRRQATTLDGTGHTAVQIAGLVGIDANSVRGYLRKERRRNAD